MKTICTLLSLFFVTAIAQGQIPNASFENWTNGIPAGWYAVNSPDTLIVRTTDAYDGTYAARFNVAGGDIPFGGYLFSGDSGTDATIGIPSIPAALNGWYKANIAGAGDVLTVNSFLTINGNGVGEVGAELTEATSVYKQFSFSYDTFFVSPGADSVFIEFGVQNQSANELSTATYFIIDDLSLGALITTGIAPVNEQAFLEQCVPNPARNTANIIYNITGYSTVSLTLYDVVGNKVKTLLDNTAQTPGRYKVPTDVSALANGIYFYSLQVDGQVYTQKLLVEK